MRKTDKPRLAFTLQVDRSGFGSDRYCVLHIRLFNQRENRCSSYDQPSITFRLQCNMNEGDEYRWYSCVFEEIKGTSLDDMDTVRKIVGKLVPRKEGSIGYFEPLPFLRAVAKHAVQVVYDCRESTEVPIAEVKPPEVKSWRDDWRTADYGDGSFGCTVSCLAVDEEEAQRLLTIEFATSIGHAGRRYYAERLAKWIAVGRPVLCVEGRSPNFESLTDILSLSEAAAERKAAADAEAQERRRKEWEEEQKRQAAVAQEEQDEQARLDQELALT